MMSSTGLEANDAVGHGFPEIPGDHSAVRQALGLRAGVKLQVVQFKDRIELIPVRSSKSLRGSLRGIDTSVAREPDRA